MSSFGSPEFRPLSNRSLELQNLKERFCGGITAAGGRVIGGEELNSLKRVAVASLNAHYHGSVRVRAADGDPIDVVPHFHLIGAGEVRGEVHSILQIIARDTGQILIPTTAPDLMTPVPTGFQAAMIYHLSQGDPSELALHGDYLKRPAAVLSDSLLARELAAVRQGDLTGYFGERIRCCLADISPDTPVDPADFIFGETRIDSSTAIALAVSLAGGRTLHFEFGRLPHKMVCGMRALTLFPDRVNETELAGDASPKSESLVSLFPSHAHHVPDDGVSDVIRDYVRAEFPGVLVGAFEISWDPLWDVEILSECAARGPQDADRLFVRIVDREGNSIVPVPRTSIAQSDPLYHGFLVAASSPDAPRCSINGLILSGKFLLEDLRRMGTSPESSLIARLLGRLVIHDLITAGVLPDDDTSDFLSFYDIRPIVWNKGSEIEIFAVSIRHTFGEHVCFVKRRLPTGIMLFRTDFQVRYFFPSREGLPDADSL